jgi:tetratricopeptide (TPR) repeat protein
MSKKLLYLPCLFFLIILLYFSFGFSLVYGEESEVRGKKSQAEDSLEAAYISLLEAERAGGDISGLVSLLNTALDYYSQADIALRSGKDEEALKLAEKAIEVTNEILEADVSIIVVSEHIEEVRFRNQLIISLGSVFFIIIFGFLGWSRFKDYYLQNMIGLRPEVVSDES